MGHQGLNPWGSSDKGKGSRVCGGKKETGLRSVRTPGNGSGRRRAQREGAGSRAGPLLSFTPNVYSKT